MNRLHPLPKLKTKIIYIRWLSWKFYYADDELKIGSEDDLQPLCSHYGKTKSMVTAK